MLQSKRNDDAMNLLKEISRINRAEINDMELSQFLKKPTTNDKKVSFQIKSSSTITDRIITFITQLCSKIEAKSLVAEEETGKPTRYTYIHLLKAGFLRKRILILVGVW